MPLSFPHVKILALVRFAFCAAQSSTVTGPAFVGRSHEPSDTRPVSVPGVVTVVELSVAVPIASAVASPTESAQSPLKLHLCTISGGASHSTTRSPLLRSVLPVMSISTRASRAAPRKRGATSPSMLRAENVPAHSVRSILEPSSITTSGCELLTGLNVPFTLTYPGPVVFWPEYLFTRPSTVMVL